MAITESPAQLKPTPFPVEPTAVTSQQWSWKGHDEKMPVKEGELEETLLSREQQLGKEYLEVLAQLKPAPSPENLKIFEAGLRARFVGLQTTINSGGVSGSVDVAATQSRLEALKHDAQSRLTVQQRTSIIDWFITKIKANTDDGMVLYKFLVDRQVQVV